MRSPLRGIVVALVVLGLLPGGAGTLVGAAGRDQVPARVLTPKGQEIGVLVNGQLHPHPGAVGSPKLLPCSPAIDNGPIWAFCRDGFYFSNV